MGTHIFFPILNHRPFLNYFTAAGTFPQTQLEKQFPALHNGHNLSNLKSPFVETYYPPDNGIKVQSQANTTPSLSSDYNHLISNNVNLQPLTNHDPNMDKIGKSSQNIGKRQLSVSEVLPNMEHNLN